MENDLLKLINSSDLDRQTIFELRSKFSPLYDHATNIAEKTKTLIVTDSSQILEMKSAGECRVIVNKLLLQAEKFIKDLKGVWWRSGKKKKVLIKIFQLFSDLLQPMEKHFFDQEHFTENHEKRT